MHVILLVVDSFHITHLQAAMFGSGCWAERRSAGGRSVACSVSGQGELIMQSFLAKTLAERTVANTEGDTHEVLRSVLVDQFYGASLVILSQMLALNECFCGRASERRQVESPRRASAGCGRASSHSRRGWGRKHQFVAFPSTFTSRGLPFLNFNALHCIPLHSY